MSKKLFKFMYFKQCIDKNVTSYYLTMTRNCKNETNVYKISSKKLLLKVFV